MAEASEPRRGGRPLRTEALPEGARGRLRPGTFRDPERPKTVALDVVHFSPVRRTGVQLDFEAVFGQEPRGGQGVFGPSSSRFTADGMRRAALGIQGRSAWEVFGSPDDLKLRSCATLFASLSPAGSVFDRLIAKFFQGNRDAKTLRLIGITVQDS